MHARDPQHARDTRLQSLAPLAALIGPLALIVVSAVNVMLPCDGRGCVDLERRSLVLLGAGAPGFPALVALPGSLPLIVSMLGGGLLSIPVWALAGRLIAGRTVTGGGGWRRFWLRYALVFGTWCLVVLIAAAILS